MVTFGIGYPLGLTDTELDTVVAALDNHPELQAFFVEARDHVYGLKHPAPSRTTSQLTVTQVDETEEGFEVFFVDEQEDIQFELKTGHKWVEGDTAEFLLFRHGVP